ncbi:uncharacterized protein LOC142235458 [Haematobia irritans]|uniref:uncharacterized protein LOC142235458 n=1 Tax=Haematobia irritans TaxID=7368 RepID=UPI003F50B3DE
MINIVYQGVTYPARALIDPASEASFITERLQNRLKLEVQTTRVTISGVNSAVSATSNRLCTLKIGSPLDASILLETTAWVLPSISGNLPTFSISTELRSEIPNIQLADANLFVSRPVEVLLGADLYPKILLEGCRQITSASLHAQNSIFGWLVTGPIPVAQVCSFSTTISVRDEDDIEKTLLRFWQLEETPRGKSLPPSDRFCEENFVRTTRRDSDVSTSLLRKPDIKVVYDNVVREYLELDHMRPVSSTVPPGTLSCYLPHHPVINLAKQSTKLRVVFNASNKTSNGNSLNDILHVGPTLQLDLVLLILRWRLYKFVFNCDITQMYRQIRVDPAHTPLQRILFRDSPDGTIRDYELQTVTFGVNCAPYLAIRTLLQSADDTEDRCPLAAHILRKSMYVDDVLSGGHDLESALAARDQLVAALSTAKFELRKWTANDRALLDGLPLEYLVDAQVLSFVEASSSKPLGIRWNAQLDSFYFSVDPISRASTELHVFSDASEKAYAGVVYIRVVTPDGRIFVHLLSCKTRVAHLKSISLPRLELCGAVLASELLKTIVREIGIGFSQVYCWTDSTIVLSWLRKTPSTWTTFVANRVCRIQENVGHGNWYHVRSEDNPADIGSRGVTPADLAASRIWWHGPHWLSRDYGPFGTWLSRTHSAYRGRVEFPSLCISSAEIRETRLRLVVLAQRANYASDYMNLLRKRPLDSKSSLLALNPFVDDKGVMRMNGRLSRSPTLSYSERHPIILPYGCRFSKLLVSFVHLVSIHGGNQLVLRILRIEYWIPRVKNLVRTVIHNCKPCILERKRSCSQIMAALPPERTIPDRPFTITGVDFAGPFEIKSFTGRYCKITKGYVCVFVCFGTKAIHLEAVSDLSTANFLAAFHRFIARRGCPDTIFSDNGTNFVGASREIERDFKAFLREGCDSVSSAFAHRGLSWRFIPAGAPHMGGLWEAGVKSFKLHFRKEAQNLRHTFEELSTVLARIEACLNSRPLCPLSEDPDELDALTPGHFLIGAPLLAPAEVLVTEKPLSLVNRFRKVQALAHQFCIRWKEEYLKSLHMRYKWKCSERSIAQGDLVVIRHEQLPPTSWRLGRVVDVFPIMKKISFFDDGLEDFDELMEMSEEEIRRETATTGISEAVLAEETPALVNPVPVLAPPQSSVITTLSPTCVFAQSEPSSKAVAIEKPSGTESFSCRDCVSGKGCEKCGGDHHTRLHSDPVEADRARKSRTSRRAHFRTPVVSSRIGEDGTRACAAAAMIGHLPLQCVVSLSPSLVVRISSSGGSVAVRAVIDNCTRQSQICASMVANLRLPVSTIDGARICRLTVAITAGLDGVVVFFDEILVTASDKKGHIERLEKVLKILHVAGFKLSPEKYKNGLHVNPDKVSEIANISYPKNVNELQTFLGMVNFYRRFIPDMSTVLEPLHELLRQT